MSPREGMPLDPQSGMLREELEGRFRLIKAERNIEIMESEKRLGDRFQSGLSEVRTEMKAGMDGLRAELKADMNSLHTKLDAALDNQSQMKSQIAGVENLAIEVQEETEDGRKITKKFRTWGETIVDLKTIISLIGAGTVYQAMKWAIMHWDKISK